MRRRVITLIVVISSLLIVTLFTRLSTSTQLEQVQKTGKLVVVTRNSATTYYQGPNGATGFEYDMLSLFAKQLGVSLELRTPENFADVLPMVAGGSADVAAAGITITEKRKQLVNFGPSYITNTQQLIFRSGANKRPHNIGDTVGKKLHIIGGSSHEESLQQLKQTYVELEWQAITDADTEELMRQVDEEQIDFTIADSNDVKVNRRFMPELRVAFDLTDPEQVAWAFKKSEDTSLPDAATAFFTEIEENGQPIQLIKRHFGHIKRFDYVDKRTFLRHIENRLPLYELSFKQAAQATGFDWRLLAAVGYQESHWDPNATSPTGVRGLMMLTQATAASVKVKDRLDPRQAIFGGARYLKQQKNRIAERIQDPDRTWMALASYNVGFGHLEDARILAQKQGKNPDTWVDVKSTLPLLTKKKYHSQTKHGYARGYEPVHYVSNIRDYYQVLVWYSERDQEKNLDETPEIELREPSAL